MLLFLVLALGIVIFLVLVVLLVLLRQDGPRPDVPPGPRTLPLVGNLHHIIHPSPHHRLWHLSLLHGPLMSLKLGFRNALVISSATVAEKAVKQWENEFSNRAIFFGSSTLFYGSSDIAFSPYGEFWRKVRRISMLHLFSAKKIRSFPEVREQEISRMVRDIAAKSERGCMVNIGEIVLPLALSIVCRIAYGKDYSEEITGRELLKDAQAAMGGLFLRDYFGRLGGLIDMLREATRRLGKVCEERDKFFEMIIDEHRHVGRLPDEEEDMIDVLLSDENLTIKQVKGVVMDMLVGGTDTNSAALEWTMTALMKNPRVMATAQKEVRSLLRNNKEQNQDQPNDMVNEDHLNSLPYLKAVVKEALRLYPPVPLLITRETIGGQDKTIIGGYEIKPKTLLYINVWAIGRDTEAWGEDAEEFVPERFLAKDGDKKDYRFMVFGIGRRRCPGMDMGIGILEISLANLLYRFDWELPEGIRKEDVDLEVHPGITMHRKTDLCLVAREYRP